MSKQSLRTSLASVLRILPSKEVELQSKFVTESLQKLVEPNKRVACFMSMDQGEVDTQYILNYMFQQNDQVYLPRCTHTKITKHAKLRDSHDRDHPHLTFHRMQSWEQVNSLKPQGKYKLREPFEELPAPLPPQLDVVLVPGVAFSLKDGSRLGWGAGYYDDFFKRYQLQHNGDLPLLIGLALKEQLVEEIKVEEHDYKMDCIVVGDGEIHWINK